MEFKPKLFKTKFENYLVDKEGRVYDVSNRLYLKQHLSKKGYLIVSLKISNKRVTYIVHRLIAETFVSNPYNKPQVNHIDGNKQNNNISNLEWNTVKENIRHAWANGLTDNTNASESLKKKIIDVSTNVVYDSLTEASNTFGIKLTTLSMMLRGNNKNRTNLKYIQS